MDNVEVGGVLRRAIGVKDSGRRAVWEEHPASIGASRRKEDLSVMVGPP